MVIQSLSRYSKRKEEKQYTGVIGTDCISFHWHGFQMGQRCTGYRKYRSCTFLLPTYKVLFGAHYIFLGWSSVWCSWEETQFVSQVAGLMSWNCRKVCVLFNQSHKASITNRLPDNPPHSSQLSGEAYSYTTRFCTGLHRNWDCLAPIKPLFMLLHGLCPFLS